MTNINTPSNTDFCLEDGIGYVSLIQHAGNDAMIVNSARVSFGKKIETIEEKDRKLIRYLLEHNHGTPLEHTSLTYLVKCPLFVARQWHRHRVGISINEISGRYVEVKDEFYIPNKFRKQSKSNRQASV
ncbi:MAG TPA: FAD-dependent thymidylate synthase, partial [Vampirovibrionales bacterium]